MICTNTYMKKCLYCNEFIDIENDDYQKVGKKLICVFCYEEYADEIDNSYVDEEEFSREEE
ncbi:hypothetical protein EB151_01235 [archaeon]|nr:hypothetical protein [archaeon]